MENVEGMKFPGYPTKEIEEFLGENLITEQRQGMAVAGFFLKWNGKSRLLQRGDYIIKHPNGDFTIGRSLYGTPD